MRYTTVIDISEFRDLYENHNIRVLYLHMALKCGYRDDDRDMLPMSIRTLAGQVGISLSACRHALRQLQKHHLITRQGDTWIVTKWVLEKNISPRAKSKREEQLIERRAERERQQAERERQAELLQIQRRQDYASGKSSWMIYFERRLAKAQAGSAEDAAWCQANRANYEAQAKEIANNNENEKKQNQI